MAYPANLSGRALPLAAERAVEQRPGQAVADRCDVREFGKCEIGRDAYPLSNRGSEIGSTAVAGAWFAFYVIATIRAFVISGN